MSDSVAKPRVLIVDDEIQIRRLLRFTLEDAGYVVEEAEKGRTALTEIAHHQPDLVILDIGLPDISGLEVLTKVREWTALPVLILSVFGQEDKKIQALDAGADDYLTKPFGGGELLARLRALLRRTRGGVEPTEGIQFGLIEMDLVSRHVTKAGKPVKLTAKEYDLLRYLATHRDKVVTHRTILENVWGSDAEKRTHYLRVFMMRLRRKIEDDPDLPQHLLTESGIGYRLVSEPLAG